MVETVRQRPREMDAHAAQRPAIERQVQVRHRHAAWIERRGAVADADDERAVDRAGVDLDRAGGASIAMLDDVADELVDGLDEIGRGRLVRSGLPGASADEGPDLGEPLADGVDRQRLRVDRPGAP